MKEKRSANDYDNEEEENIALRGKVASGKATGATARSQLMRFLGRNQKKHKRTVVKKSEKIRRIGTKRQP